METGMNDSIERLVELLKEQNDRTNRAMQAEMRAWVQEAFGLKDLLVDSDGNIIIDSENNFIKAVQ